MNTLEYFWKQSDREIALSFEKQKSYGDPNIHPYFSPAQEMELRSIRRELKVIDPNFRNYPEEIVITSRIDTFAFTE